jgi:hypothetical protein
MLETVEFRIDEDKARRFLRPDQGTVVADIVRQIEVSRDDPLYREIERLDREARAIDEVLFASWEIRREYSQQELEAAELLRLTITAAFEPVGEECGTVYDDRSACSHCGWGRVRTSELVLDLSRVPKADFARTLADEWIVSQHLAELFVDEGITGVELSLVRHSRNFDYESIDLTAVPSGRTLLKRAEAQAVSDSAWDFSVWLNRPQQEPLLDAARREYESRAKRRIASRPPADAWYELKPSAKPVSVVAPTHFGTDPFDDDPEGEYRCPCGHVAGLAVLSEVHVARNSWNGTDFAVTDRCVGRKQGVLMPAPLILISPRLWRLLEENDLRGYEVEVAHLV